MDKPASEHSSWQELADMAHLGQTGQGAIVWATKRLVDTIKQADEAAQKLSGRVYWLNAIIVVCTAVITAVTLWQVFR